MTEVLFITHKYPPMIGGMEKQSFHLIKGMSRHYKTHVIAYQNNGNKLLWFIRLKSKIKATLKENPGIKLIHLNDGLMGVACLWLQRYTSIPIVVTYHGLDITFPHSFFQNKLIPKLTNYSGAICVSESTRNLCIKRGFNEKLTFTVRNGIDNQLANIQPNENIKERLQNLFGIDISNKRIIVSTGRLVKRKGFSWFLRNVMPSLDKDIIFLMMGPLNNKPTFSEKIVQCLPEKTSGHLQLMLGHATDTKDIIKFVAMQESVYHLGKVSDDDLFQLLLLADLFVMPNIAVEGDTEGFGLVALEACIKGTYVLASGIEGITDAVINGENGCLLPSENAQAWTNKIHELLSDRHKLKMLSQQGKEYTRKHYSWEIMADGYKDVFDKLI
jgi:glycosyltransferase involved in cell wall biosynthesis